MTEIDTIKLRKKVILASDDEIFRAVVGLLSVELLQSFGTESFLFPSRGLITIETQFKKMTKLRLERR